jgi:hypothetical protein
MVFDGDGGRESNIKRWCTRANLDRHCLRPDLSIIFVVVEPTNFSSVVVVRIYGILFA